MDLKLLYAIFLTLMPITELRIGLPLAISYSLENNIPILLIFFLIVFINIILIFFIFFFLDTLHKYLLQIDSYKKIFQKFLKKFQKKVDKFEKKHEELGFLALALFVAIPLPGTGAWSGCLLAWILKLDRKKSLIAISMGILIAGILVLLGSLGFIELLNLF